MKLEQAEENGPPKLSLTEEQRAMLDKLEVEEQLAAYKTIVETGKVPLAFQDSGSSGKGSGPEKPKGASKHKGTPAKGNGKGNGKGTTTEDEPPKRQRRGR